MSNRDAIKEQLDNYLSPFDLKTSGILELPDGSWACQLVDIPSGEYLGKVRGDKVSTIDKCLTNGYELMADFSKDRKADVQIVANAN